MGYFEKSAGIFTAIADNKKRGIVMKKSVFAAVIFGIFLNFNAAAMVTFFVVETGLPDNMEYSNQSIVWENAFMDVFFEAGHIISNFPIIRLDSKPEGDILYEIDFDLENGREMGINFIIIALLEYDDRIKAPGEISFFIFNVVTGEKSYERQITGKTYRSVSEEFNDIKSIARGLIPFVR